MTVHIMQKEVAQAETHVLAEVRGNEAESYWTAQGKTMNALEGFNSNRRVPLVERFPPEAKNVRTGAVTERCSEFVHRGAFCPGPAPLVLAWPARGR